MPGAPALQPIPVPQCHILWSPVDSKLSDNGMGGKAARKPGRGQTAALATPVGQNPLEMGLWGTRADACSEWGLIGGLLKPEREKMEEWWDDPTRAVVE